MRRLNHRLRLKQYISQTGMHSRTGYICFAFLHYAGAYLMKVMKVRYIICQSVCWVMTQGLGGGEGERSWESFWPRAKPHSLAYIRVSCAHSISISITLGEWRTEELQHHRASDHRRASSNFTEHRLACITPSINIRQEEGRWWTHSHAS